MKQSIPQPRIHVAIAEDDPLRVIGFRSLLESEQDFELHPVTLKEMGAVAQADIVLWTERKGHSLADEVDKVKAALPGARVLATGSSRDEGAVLQSIAFGAKGYINETASSAEFAQAIRIVHRGLIWAPRRVLATLIGRAADFFPKLGGRATLTHRQKDILQMLAAGRSNKEIAAPLGIKERTVKAHVGQLMRKFGVRNRIELSVHSITHSIVE